MRIPIDMALKVGQVGLELALGVQCGPGVVEVHRP